MAQVLPYFDQRSVYNHLNFNAGLYEPPNATTRTNLVRSFLCPSDRGPSRGPGRVAMASYAGVHHDVEAPIASDNHGVLFLNSRVRYEDVTDGTSQTFFVGEKLLDNTELGWASGTRASLRNGGIPAVSAAGGPIAGAPGNALGTGPQAPAGDPLFVGGFASSHPGIMNFLVGDGSTRVIKNLSPLQRLTHRADGVPIDASAFNY
jgi:hypothetical protein